MSQRRCSRPLLPALLAAVWLPASAHGAAPPRVLFAPSEPTDSEHVHLTLLGEAGAKCSASFVAWTEEAERRIVAHGYSFGAPPCAAPVWTETLPLGQLARGDWEVDVQLDEQPYVSTALTVVPSPTQVVIGSFEYYGTNFRMDVKWRDPRDGQLRQAPGLALSREAAQFWFFAPGNPEVTVKILDGTAINGHHWLFLSTLSGVEMTFRVFACVEGDPPNCGQPKEYHIPAGTNLDVVDVEAF